MSVLKRFLIVLLTSLSGLAHAGIIDQHGYPTPAVLSVFRQLAPLIKAQASEIQEKQGLQAETIEKILDPRTPAKQISLADLNAIAQVVFLRPAHLERKDLAAFNEQFRPYATSTLMQAFADIGDRGNIVPAQRAYNYILIHGATIPTMRNRLYAVMQWVKEDKLEIREDTTIVFLTGERDLFPEETAEVIHNAAPFDQNPSWGVGFNLPTNESEAAEWIWHQSDLGPDLRKAKVIFVKVPKVASLDPQTRATIYKRPTTLDTVQAWVGTYQPSPGSCLSVSSQPFVYYQLVTTYGILKKLHLLEKGFTVEGVGMDGYKTTSFEDHIAVYLDNLARTIYTHLQISPQ